jgi:hypothetical protein
MKGAKKILRKILFGLILGLTVIFFESCLVNPCESTNEPSLIVLFRNQVNNKIYSKVFSSDGRVKFNFVSNYIKLPLSLNDDQLTYIFSNDVMSDTLSINYQRNFKFQSTKCGFTVSLENIAVVKPTSFKNLSTPYLSNLNDGEYTIFVY